MAASATPAAGVHVLWLRKSLRLHDSPALLAACSGSSSVQPVFVLDPHFLRPAFVGGVRLRFLLESLLDLDARLQKRNSRLVVLHGAPETVLPQALRAWNAQRLCFGARSHRLWRASARPLTRVRGPRVGR